MSVALESTVVAARGGDPPAAPTDGLQRGYALGAGAFLWWGLMPIWFKALAHVPVLTVLAHRIVWMAVFLLALLGVRGRIGELRLTLRRGHERRRLLLSTALIAFNWFVFLYSVMHSRVLESSLGYFINPLFSIVLGVVLLGERLRAPQMAAVLLAATGVVWLAISNGRPPWISLALAVSFGLYGLVRKTMATDAVLGLAIESMLVTPIALGWLLFAATRGDGALAGASAGTAAMLVLGGPVTAGPLMLFVAAARRLPLATIGFLQYLAPTLQFLLAVVVYGESFTRAHAVAFGLIWCAVAIYLADALRSMRALDAAARPR